MLIAFGCSSEKHKNISSSSEILINSAASQSKRNYSSVDLAHYDGENLIRSVLNKAAYKYYKKSIVEHLNSKLFSNKLTISEKKEIEMTYTNPTSKRYVELAVQLGNKYKTVLNKNLEEDENYNDVSELNLYIVFEINRLFNTEEVQKELIESVFTNDRKEKLFGYYNLVKRSILEKVTPMIDNHWSGQRSFYEVVKSTELFWPDFNYLKPFFKRSTINKNPVSLVSDTDRNDKEISKIYLRYLNQGYSFYTTSNASFGYFGFVESNTQAMLIQPVFFSQIKNNILSDFSIIGILAHELGHAAGYFSRLRYEQDYNPTVGDTSYFENEILLPFYECYTSGKRDLDYAKVQYQETRSDYIAYLVMKDFKDSLKSEDESLYLEMINLFRKFTTEKIRADDDPHPFLEYRDRIVSGQCQLKVIFPFTKYNENL